MTSAELPSSLASPPSSPRLTVELLAQIVDEATGDGDKLDYTTLRHLCLASKSILPVARSALYRDITVTIWNAVPYVEDDVSTTEPDARIEVERAWFNNDADVLKATLVCASHLVHLVTGLIIRCENGVAHAVQLPQYLARFLLRICPNIASFRLLKTSFVEVEAVVAELLNEDLKLAQLEIDTTDNMNALLPRLALLRHLHLRDCDAEFSFGSSSFPLPAPAEISPNG